MAEPEERQIPAFPPDAEAEKPSATISIDGRIIWQAIGAIIFTLIAIWALREASRIMAMLAISFFFSLALDPGVRYFVGKRGWRRGAAVGVIYLLGVIVVALLILVMIPALTQLADAISGQGAEWGQNLSDWASDTFGATLPGLEGLGEGTAGAGEGLGDFSEEPFGTVLGVVSGGVSFVFDLFTIASFTFYFTADAPRVKRAVLRLFSSPTKEQIDWTWDQAIVQTGGYFYSRLLLMLINGLGFFFTLVLVGISPALSLAMALFGGFVSVFIPVIGTYIGGAVPTLLALALEGLSAALIVLAYILIYQQIENLFLSPRLSAKTMTLSGGVAFAAAMIGGAIAGPMGAFTALPVAALISSVMSNYLAARESSGADPDDGAELVSSGASLPAEPEPTA